MNRLFALIDLVTRLPVARTNTRARYDKQTAATKHCWGVMDVLMSSVSHVAGFVTAHWFTVAAATIVPLLLYFFGTRETRKLKAAFGDMPGPKPWPFLGGMPDAIKFKGQMHLLIDHYYKEYGRQFPFSFFGMCTLNVADPEMVRQVLVKDFDSFHDRVVSNQVIQRIHITWNIGLYIDV